MRHYFVQSPVVKKNYRMVSAKGGNNKAVYLIKSNFMDERLRLVLIAASCRVGQESVCGDELRLV